MPYEFAHFSRRQLLSAAACAALAAWTGGASAQDPWPSKPIRFVVPFAAGVSPDVVARIISDPLSRALGQPVVVDNRAGAAGIIGADIAAKSPPDGYTIFMAVNSIMGVNPNVYTKLPYDTFHDFTPITQVAIVPYVLITGPRQPYNSLTDLIDKAKAHPKSIEYGSLGVGSGPHVVMEMMNNMARIQMLHVPYKGSPLQDVLAGQIPLAFETATTAVPLIKTGKAKALAITSPRRSPALPDVPTVAELLPGYDGDGWQGIYAPAKTPKPIVDRLNLEIAKILKSPETQKKLDELGLIAVGSTVDDFARVSRSEYDKWGKIAKANHIRVEN